jgi:GNAT superfamily N-acetyltransferase
MEVKTDIVQAQGIKFTIEKKDREIARAYLYIMYNDLHEKPFGLLEDVSVDENNRGKGLGTKLIERVIAAAKDEGCYKLIATSRKSRSKVHQLYNKLGFQEYGLEFRMDLYSDR